MNIIKKLIHLLGIGVLLIIPICIIFTMLVVNNTIYYQWITHYHIIEITLSLVIGVLFLEHMINK